MKDTRSDEVRQNWRDVLNDVEHQGEHVTVLRYTTPAAVIVPVDWYRKASDLMSQGDTMSEASTAIPEAGRLYRYDDGELVFVTSASSSADHWAVAGYLVTRSYVLTETLEGWSGPNGTHYGVPREPFCNPAGVPAGSEGQRPLFSARFPASDHSRVTAVEAQGRKRHMRAAAFPVNVCKYCEKMLVPGTSD